tara:strand:+ start:25477 stop:26517 length:1041 start_codon:yes stop_codon:yes gene_type:complete
MITINGIKIGIDHKPFIIAEMSANHGGSIDRAKASILSAKKSGASAIKMQSYTPDTMTIESNNKDFIISSGLWKNYNLYNLYKEAFTPFEWHAELFNYSKKIGITIFSTPFDESAIDLLINLDTPAFKIASFELTDLHLIKYAAKYKKPMLISTGMGSLQEINEAVEVCKKMDNNNILLFHCISNYPAKEEDSHLNNIRILSNYFNLDIGLSDHSVSNFISKLAITIGAVAIEKHFKIDNKECGPDSTFSILPSQFKDLVSECNLAYQALGPKKFMRPKKERESLKFRRSIYFIKNLKKGNTIKKNDIKRIRPGFGIAPKYFDYIVGKKLEKDVKKGDAVKWDCFK